MGDIRSQCLRILPVSVVDSYWMMDPNGENMPQQLSTQQNHYFSRQLLRALIVFMMVAITCLAFYQSSTSPAQLLSKSISSFSTCHAKTCTDAGSEELVVLDQVLKRASMDDKTVILTTLNEAWIEPDSIFDLFLKSFSIGNQTLGLLQHLVVVALDKKAYDYCSNTLHLNCYNLTTKDVDLSGEAHFMTPGYLKMMWRRIDFLRRVLEMGYNFVFTDADIMWLRNPLPHFYSDTDFQISCDYFKGDPSDVENAPNGGFNYVKSSKKTIKFYKFWYKSRQHYPGLHDQDVFNKIKYDPYVSDIGLKIKYLDTAYFGGFCEPSKDMNVVCTMHANCCAGLDNKIHDLNILLEDWTNYLSLPENVRKTQAPSWLVPQSCGPSSFSSHTQRKKNGTRTR